MRESPSTPASGQPPRRALLIGESIVIGIIAVIGGILAASYLQFTSHRRDDLQHALQSAPAFGAGDGLPTHSYSGCAQLSAYCYDLVCFFTDDSADELDRRIQQAPNVTIRRPRAAQTPLGSTHPTNVKEVLLQEFDSCAFQTTAAAPAKSALHITSWGLDETGRDWLSISHYALADDGSFVMPDGSSYRSFVVIQFSSDL